MTSLTLSEARDSIQTLFFTAWAALTPAVVGGSTPVRIVWDGVDDGTLVDAQRPYANVLIRHFDGRQATFSNPSGLRRFARTGLVTVQIYTPLLSSVGLSVAENLATIARDAFEGVSSPEGIWFTLVATKEVGPDGRGFYQFNVTAQFRYDEVK